MRSNVVIRPCVWPLVFENMVSACAWHRLIRRLGSLLFVLAKSNQKPLSSKGSLFFDLRL